MKISVITPTHDPKWLIPTYRSLCAQTFRNWQWVVVCNSDKAPYYASHVREIVSPDPRVDVHEAIIAGGIGAIKAYAFRLGDGDILVELDHDDMLTPDALERLAEAAERNPRAGFFYSDCIDMQTPPYLQGEHTYMAPGAQDAWAAQGWQFDVHDRHLVYPVSFEPSAAALCTIQWAPNHLRAWRRDLYHRLGGHNANYDLADDHELLVRTYLETEMQHIPAPLYLYRVDGQNTYPSHADRIWNLSSQIGKEYLERLILREAHQRSLPVYDLGCRDNLRSGWQGVDIDTRSLRGRGITADLRNQWPFEDNSVMAFRAHDLLEHLPDKEHTMSEIHRCLVPGGWLLSSTPSTDGRGAFMDPTHVSYWNQNSFWYWTRTEQMRFIDNTDKRFSVAQLHTHFPSQWHQHHNIPYVVANLIADKPGYKGPRFHDD